MKINLLAIKAIVIVSAIGLTSCNADDEYFDIGYSTLAEGLFTRSGDPGGDIENPYNYPTKSEILADPAVRSKMDALWQQTLTYASIEGRREYGCYICYNNIRGYYFEDFPPGPIITTATNAEITFPGTQNIDACAVFHTHTTLEYCDSTAQRYTGASDRDRNGNHARMMPCFVYDYQTPLLIGGMSKNSPAEVYGYGQDFRH